MELWIRSQDKTILQKVNKIYAATYAEEKGFGIYDINCDDIDDCDVPLGFYTTKERALEVLDEIEERISLFQTIKLATGNEVMMKAFKISTGEDKLKGLCRPYKMPKE